MSVKALSLADINVPGYKLLGKLGSGSYSTVFKASPLDNPQEYVAVKCMSLANKGKDLIINEIEILKLLKHEFIVKLIEFQWDDKYIYLILEYCELGDLSSFMNMRHVRESTFRKFLQQLALGLQFLRSHNVSHFDLKPQNLLLTKRPKLTLKIGDFGFAQFLLDESLKTSENYRGSPLYMAPEMLLKRQISPKADLWSIGILSYHCLFGQPPIAKSSSLCFIVKNHRNQVPIEIPKNVVSSECEDLLSRLIVYDPLIRMDFDEFFNHPFLDLEHYPTEESYLKAVRLIHDAVRLDYEKQYKEAFKIYCQALQYLVPYLKDLDDRVKKELIQKKVLEYTRRAEELQIYLTKDIATTNEEVKAPQESQCEDESRSGSLESLCQSTPALVTAMDMGKVGHMYLLEKNYAEALEKFKSALSIAVPLLQKEPPGQRKDLLVNQIEEWLTCSENIKGFHLLRDLMKPEPTSECQDGCVLQ